MQLLASSAGYQLARREQELLFVRKHTRGPALVAWIAGGLSFALAVMGVVLGLQRPMAALIMGPAALLLGWVARLGYLAYKRRRDAPVEDHVQLCADLAAGELRARGGARVCALSEVTVTTRMNMGDSTQGFMRWVILSWPGGRARVFSAASSHAREVAAMLAKAGVGRFVD